MSDNRVRGRRRNPPRRARARPVRYEEFNSDEIVPVSPESQPLQPPQQSSSPEAAPQDDSTPEASQGGNSTPEDSQGGNTPSASIQGGNSSPEAAQNGVAAPVAATRKYTASGSSQSGNAPSASNQNDNVPPAAAQGGNSPPEGPQSGNSPPDPPQNGNSSPPDEPSSDAPETPRAALPPGYHDLPMNFTRQFWDSLTRVWLTRRGLRELDRRNNSALPTPVLERPKRRPKSMARWAMHGGPDTRHLRGYKDPKLRSIIRARTGIFVGRHPRADPLSAYDANLGQWLHDNGIYLAPEPPAAAEQPSNNFHIERALKTPFPSLQPHKFTEGHFRRWRKLASKAEHGEGIRAVFKVITGGMGELRGRDEQLSNLEPLAGGIAPVVPAPTAFDASPAASLQADALEELAGVVLPVAGGELAAPNLFVEASGSNRTGVGEVEARRACYHGALGARAMHAMQNFGTVGEPLYERAAHSFSATYGWAEGLSLYAHHISLSPEGRVEYHMSPLGTWHLKKSRKQLADGIAAFRNLVDLARSYREHMVEVVNGMMTSGSSESEE